MEAANKRRGLLRSFLATAPPSLAMERIGRPRLEAAIERRGLLRSFLAPAPSSLAMERLWSSRMEAAIEALESTRMEAAFLSVVRAASCGTDCATARSSPALRRRLARAGFGHTAVY